MIARSSDIFLNKTTIKKTPYVLETTVKKTTHVLEATVKKTTHVPETTVKTTQTKNSSTNAAQNEITTLRGKRVGKFWKSYLL